MDAFMDKLAQKLTAQEMIRANSAADAEEMERLKKEVAEYKECLDKLKDVSGRVCVDLDKTLNESSDELKKALAEITGETLKNSVEDITTEAIKKIDELTATESEAIHKECVKVYKNVQAAMSEEAEKRAEDFDEAITIVSKKITAAITMASIAMVGALGAVGLLVYYLFF